MADAVEKVPVVEVIRASSQLQGQDGKESIPRQKRANAETAARLNLEIIRSYTLIDVSGGDLDRTPEWQAIVGLLDAGVARGVLLDDPDRLNRLTEWNFKVYADLTAHGAMVWTPEGMRDPSDPNDALYLGMRSIMGGHEKAKLARASWKAREEKRRRGEWAASCKSLTTGISYEKGTKVWSVTPEIAEVRDIFERFSSGQSINAICKETGRGKSVVSKWLRHPLYSGWLVYTTKQRGGPKIRRQDGRQPRRKAIPRADDEIIRVKVFEEPPVPLVLWEAAQARLTAGRKTYQRRVERVEGSHERFPLRGVLFCSCGQPIYGNSRKRGDGQRMPVYGCRVRLQGRLDWMQRQNLSCDTGLSSVDAVHEAVLDALAPRFRSPRYVSELAMATMEADARREDSEVAVRVAALRRKLASLEKQKPRILDLYKREIIPVEELEVERRKIDEDIASAKAAIEALGDDPDEATREEVLRDIIGGVVDVGDILAAIRQRDIGALAAALRATGSTVFVNINKGRCAPIDVTGMELRVGDMSRAQPDTPTVRAQQ